MGLLQPKTMPQCMLEQILEYLVPGIRGIDLPAVSKGNQPGNCVGQLAFVREVQLSLPAARCCLSQGWLTRGTARQWKSHLKQVPELVLLHVCIGLLLRVRSHAVRRRQAIAQVWSIAWSNQCLSGRTQHSQRAMPLYAAVRQPERSVCFDGMTAWTCRRGLCL